MTKPDTAFADPPSDYDLAVEFVYDANIWYDTGSPGSWMQDHDRGSNSIPTEQAHARILRWMEKRCFDTQLISASRIKRVEQLARMVSARRQGL